MHNFGGVGRIYSIRGGGGGGRWSKGGGGEGIFSKFRGELAKRGELKNSGGFGPWMKLCSNLSFLWALLLIKSVK